MDRESVLSKLTLKTATVDVPEWGGPVTIRELNARERFTFGEKFGGASGNKLAEAMAYVVIACSQNGSGPLFTQDDAKALLDSNGNAVQKIAEACLSLSGLTNEAVEVAEKN